MQERILVSGVPNGKTLLEDLARDIKNENKDLRELSFDMTKLARGKTQYFEVVKGLIDAEEIIDYLKFNMKEKYEHIELNKHMFKKMIYSILS